MRNPCRNCENACIKQTANREIHKPSRNMTCYKCDKIQKYREWRKSQQKYMPSEPLLTMRELEQYQGSFVYWNNRLWHIEGIKSLQYRLVANLIRNECLYKAIERKNANE